MATDVVAHDDLNWRAYSTMAKYLTNGNDYWIGTKNADIVFGRGGNDDIFGQGGKDELHGENGNDYLVGGADADKLWGDAGNDALSGNSGKDQLWGGKGDDSLNGGAGDDVLWGGDGNDRLFNNQGGLDEMHGGNGNDVVSQGIWMDGGAGDDSIGGYPLDANGRQAVVQAWGGTGRDTFDFYDDANGVAQKIVINDFSAEDRSLSWGTDNYTSGILIENGQVTVARNIEVQQDGHDLIVTGGQDHDQLVLKGAADWLHIA